MYISNKVYRGYLSMTVFYLPIHIKCSCIDFTKSQVNLEQSLKKGEKKKKKKESKVKLFQVLYTIAWAWPFCGVGKGGVGRQPGVPEGG